MLRSISAALLLAALILGVPTAAHAEGYVPPPPPQPPTIAGSTATGVCDGNVPWISFDITLVDPDSQSTSHTAYITFSDGTNTAKILLGEIVNGKLSGRILWPGASVGPTGEPTGWPGWMQVGGTWVQTTGNFGWTRTTTSVLISVNPQVVVPLSYPPATPQCTVNPPKTTVSSSFTGTLSSTGVSPMLVPIGLAAGGVVILGIAVLLVRRRRSDVH